MRARNSLKQRIQDPKSRIQDPGSRIQDPQSKIQDPGSRIHVLLHYSVDFYNIWSLIWCLGECIWYDAKSNSPHSRNQPMEISFRLPEHSGVNEFGVFLTNCQRLAANGQTNCQRYVCYLVSCGLSFQWISICNPGFSTRSCDLHLDHLDVVTLRWCDTMMWRRSDAATPSRFNALM